MVRPASGPTYNLTWTSLNGIWEFSTTLQAQTPTPSIPLARQILVPFPPESALSGLNLREVQHLQYRRTFTVR